MEKIKNYIGGELVDPLGNKFVENINPAKGVPYSQVPFSNKDDVDLAVKKAKEAFKEWKKTSREERIIILRKIAALIEENLDSLAEAESIDNGKPIRVSKTVDIPRAAENFSFYSDCLTQFGDSSFQTDSKTLNYTVHKPLGVVGLISPWNLPLYLLTWKIAPALAAGNTIVAKPSEITPMTAYLFSKLCIEAGLPPGVLNIIHGHGEDVGSPLCTHPDVKAISFTGSTMTGKKVSEMASPLFKKVSLEMGGKNPNIIFADANIEKAAKVSVHSSFANQGQICLCGSRIFVEKSIYEEFKNKLIEGVKKLKHGDPLDPSTSQGAIVSLTQFEKVLSYIELSKKDGGTILTGGKAVTLEAPFDKGFFIEPTLIENLDPYCRTNQEEIFGPVATITPFETEEQVLEWANSTEYGLSASIWTNNIQKAHRMSQEIDSGIVWVNTWMNRDLRTPFGGMKNSGVGREGGLYALKFFSEVKNICIKN